MFEGKLKKFICNENYEAYQFHETQTLMFFRRHIHLQSTSMLIKDRITLYFTEIRIQKAIN